MLPEDHGKKSTRRSARISSLPKDNTAIGSFNSLEDESAVRQTQRATLKEVSVPTRVQRSSGEGIRSNYDCSMSDNSLTYDTKSSTCGNSMKDSTRQTSVVPTPATSVKGKASTMLNSAKSEKLRKRKRKRVSSSINSELDDVLADLQMARSLQLVEYEESSARAGKGKSLTYEDGLCVMDSDSDTLSTVVSVDSSAWDEYNADLERHSSSKRQRKKGSKAQRSAPPPRRKNRLDRNTEKSVLIGEDAGELEMSDDSKDFTEGSAFENQDMSEEDLPLANESIQSYRSIRDASFQRMEEVESWMAMKSRNRKARERKKLEKAHPTVKTMWQDLEKVPIIPREQIAQPDTITRRLKPFQLEGLNWMIKQEQTHYKGGLLGDEMGMGKTIQAVSLIMSDFPAKNPTLVVVPPVALLQWSKEIEEYTNGKLKVLVFHGQKTKGFAVKDLKKYNVIMISYQSLESLYRKEVKGWNRGYDIVKEDSPIHDIHFHRVILDEAHSIKQRTTGIAKACFALKSTYKWCLSGTPVQNRIGEFFSLMRFLEVRPFADYFCKRCSCSQLHWSLNKEHRCSNCNHSGAEHVSMFNQELLNPIIQTESDALRQEALDKLRLITDRIMLRRMKRDHTSSMELPPKEIILHNEFFGEVERDFSSSIMTTTTRQFDTYVSRGVMLNNYANIFGLIMQMRQVADHPDLLLRKHAEMGQNVLVCNICDEAAEDAIRSRCKHEFCRSCIKEFIQTCEGSGGTPDCPRCHISLSIDFDQPEIEQDEDYVKKNSIINRIKMENWTSSTKIEMLVYELYGLRNKKRTLKSIVFSQFTSMLQLIEWRLRRAGFNTTMLDGSMTPTQRQRSIDYFMNNPDVEVFLVSLKAGGVALNLTEASRVFIVDPWWNPAAEWQSADRCHRIGQRRPCVITRLCIEDSVESRIVMLQEKKANMINGTINNDKVSMDKLNPEDLQFLFRGN